jgi:hypothetical protein
MADITRMLGEQSRPRRNIIADLARSIEVTVRQLGLRAKFTAVIADAEKAEYAAEQLRDTAIESAGVAESVPLVPAIPLRSGWGRDVRALSNDSAVRDRRPNQVVEDIFLACNWLAATQNSRCRQADGRNRESAIAARMAELHDRLGGLLK